MNALGQPETIEEIQYDIRKTIERYNLKGTGAKQLRTALAMLGKVGYTERERLSLASAFLKPDNSKMGFVARREIERIAIAVRRLRKATDDIPFIEFEIPDRT